MTITSISIIIIIIIVIIPPAPHGTLASGSVATWGNMMKCTIICVVIISYAVRQNNIQFCILQQT